VIGCARPADMCAGAGRRSRPQAAAQAREAPGRPARTGPRQQRAASGGTRPRSSRRLAQVLPQVEPVGDLDRLRGSGADAVGVHAGPVLAHSLDLGVLAQPGGERGGLAVGQHVHQLAGVHVDQDGVVGLAAADREVDAEHGDMPGHGDRLGAHEPDQHVTAGQPARARPWPGTRPAPGCGGRTAWSPRDLLVERRELARTGG
jgi:hypothetical protein